jgi:phage baseplate assembly protein W
MEKNMYGDIDFKEDAEAIKQSIIDILLSITGEREFMPSYGSRLFGLLHERINEFTAMQIRDEIEVTLANWEPRVRVNGVEVNTNNSDNAYDVTISFDIIRVNQSQVIDLTLERIS